MPWSTSDRGARLPTDWHARRARAYREAGGRCQWITEGVRCTWVGPLHKTATQAAGHCDHIDRAAGDSPANLRWLCPTHHLEKSSGEGHAAMRLQRAKAFHPRERHPGLT